MTPSLSINRSVANIDPWKNFHLDSSDDPISDYKPLDSEYEKSESEHESISEINESKKDTYYAKWIVLGVGAGVAVTVCFFHLATAATVAVVSALCFAALLTFEEFDSDNRSFIFEKIFYPIRSYSMRHESSAHLICILVQGVTLSIFATLGLPFCIPVSIGIIGLSLLTHHIMFYERQI